MSTFDKITFLVHTRNRPDFLVRLLDHFDRSVGLDRVNLIVLDGSDEERWRISEREMNARGFAGRIEILHASSTTGFDERLNKGAHMASTPYVVLAADDDLYLFDWLEEAVALLDADASFGTVYGHVLFFELDEYRPHGELLNCYVHPRRSPPIRWLEAPTAKGRLLELADGETEPAVTGWYAIQRTEQLRTILEASRALDLPLELLEYLLIFCQAALGKTRMLDRPFLARQEDRRNRHPFPNPAAFQSSLGRLADYCTELLRREEKMSAAEARQVVEQFFSGTARLVERTHSKRHLRRVADHLPLLRGAWNRLRGRPATAAATRASHYPDRRLPPIPNIDREHPAVKMIEEAARAPSAVPSAA